MNRKQRRRQGKKTNRPGREAVAPAGPPDNLSDNLPEALIVEAFHAAQAGDYARAESLCERLAETHPDNPDRLLIQALIAERRGDGEGSLQYTAEAVALAPGYPEARNNHAKALEALGRLDEAAAAYGEAVRLNPDFAEAHFRLGRVLARRDDAEGALKAYEEAVRARPGDGDAWMEMGNALLRLGRIDEAIEALRKAVLAKPNDPVPYYNLGCALQRAGYVERPREVFEEAVRLNPGFAEAHHALAGAWKQVNDYAKALKSYRRAIAAAPDFAPAHAGLADALREMGQVDKARESFKRALALDPDNQGLKVKSALMLPVIPGSRQEIAAARHAFAENVEALAKGGLSLSDPYAEVGMTNFYLAYHEADDRPLQEAAAAMYLAACPSLGWAAPHCGAPAKKKAKRLRVGVCSQFMRDHTIGKQTLGVIKTLSRKRFEVIVFRLPGPEDDQSKAIDAAADRVVALPFDLAAARAAVAGEAPDILFYPDIGMDPFTYFLAFARLAPVQMTSWGHPDTTGIASMDYFLSCEGMEPDASDAHYSERLVKLKDLTTYYYRPKPPARDFTRAGFGLPDDAPLYLFPQTLFKIHPDFDRVFADLLGRDPEGRLVLIDDPFGGYWRKRLMKRFKGVFPAHADRVLFVPKMPLEDYFGLLTVADAVLDVPTFSGGNSSIEAFALGVPVVTWPGGFARGRITHACYRQMGIGDLTATDAGAFVGLCLRLAKDKDFHAAMKEKILAGVGRLFENKAMLAELEDFLEAAHDAWRRGDGLVSWIPGGPPERI